MNGLLIQWGVKDTSSVTEMEVAMPYTSGFANTTYTVVMTRGNDSGNTMLVASMSAYSKTSTSFTTRGYDGPLNWVAFGIGN